MKIIKKLFPTAEKRAYNKMTRRHRKELIKEIKNNTYDYDFDELHSLVILKIQHFYEYYNKNKNVWQSEEDSQKIIKQLKEILILAKELEFLSDAYNLKREIELYQEIYTLIGKNIMNWWD